MSVQVKVSTIEREAPIGKITIVVGEAGLCAVDFGRDEKQVLKNVSQLCGDEVTVTGRATEAATRIDAYFDGDLHALDALPVEPMGGTDFQRRVWRALREIDVGTTQSYGQLAGRLGLGRAGARAVGSANGDNPIAVVVPCHRVIGANGALVGYASGLPRKQWLLRHEGALLV